MTEQELQVESERKPTYLLFLLPFLIGLTGVLFFCFRQTKKAEPETITVSSAAPTPFVMVPPKEAMTGKLLSFRGEVKKNSREDEEPQEVKTQTEILQGEKITTGQRSQANIEFPDFVKMNLGQNTELGFINLLAGNFLLQQSSGLVNYQVLSDKAEISVRSLHSLMTFSSQAEISVNEGIINLIVFEGEAKLALVDLANETRVYELKKGQKASINDALRRVTIK